MQKKPLSCLTFTGILAALITAATIAGLGIAQGGALFSPGPLNGQAGAQVLGGVHSHAETGGNCAACHASPWDRQGMSERCLDCHTDLTNDPQNFHRVMLAQSQTTGCYFCHTDHHGRSASMTIMDLKNFPHQSLGFSLQAHQKMANGADFACSDCHGASLAKFDQADCGSCHTQLDANFMQAHLQAYGTGCLACHDGVDRFGKNFDHSRLAFQLTGKHLTVSCTDCHTGAKSASDFTLAPQDCSTCHAKDDAHQGQFGQNCSACHTPDDWKNARFDHSMTAFKLTGAHAKVECAKCHVNNVFKGTPQECAACHAKDDTHQGQFGQNCAGCHTPDDWKKASFDHSLAAFKLTGAHINVECTKCHVNNVFKGTPQECASCHPEPAFHAGLFPSDCATCHTTQGWSPAQFNGPHTFPINHGEGGANSCKTCHPDNLQTYTCYGCHDPNEVAAKHREEGITNFSDCISCHPTGQGEGGGD